MKVTEIRLLQSLLAEAGFDPGPADGKVGPRTYAATRAALTAASETLPDGWRGWHGRRQAVLYLQLRGQRAGLETGPLDGLWGPQTEYAVEQLRHIREHGAPEPPWRDEQPRRANPHGWPAEDALRAFYGDPGEQLVMLELPYPLRLAWQPATRVSRTQCHRRVRDSLRAALEAVLAHYGSDGIRTLRLDLYGGGYNHRTKRGGSTLSTHAWGIAFDFDPAHNKLRWGRDRAAFARPDYEAWWRCWEAEGWVGLGRERNFDWMHVQAARLG